jgi:CBS domain-containing protein
VTIAHACTVLTLRRSILTEKVSRRGYHLTREYSIDPLEILFVREVVRSNIVALSAAMTLEEARTIVGESPRPRRRQRLYPVVDHDHRLLGVVTRSHLEHSIHRAPPSMCIADIAHSLPVVAHPDEPLRAVVHRMASTGLTRFPVVERGLERRLVGMISLSDLLAGRTRTLDAEHRRERVFSLGLGSRSPFEALVENENGLDGGRVEAVCRAPIRLLGIYELLRSGPTSMRERRSLFAAARFLSDPAAERVPHGPTHLRATSGPLGRQLAISLRTK